MSSTIDTGTSAVRLTAAAITQYLASRRYLHAGKRQVVLLRAAPVWDGAPELTWGPAGCTAHVAAAPSPLAAYELVLGHLNAAAPESDVLVILTDREESELGGDLLAKVYGRRVGVVDSWDVVREAFGATVVDSRLFAENWAAESLLDATPPGRWPQLAGGALSRGHALTSLALRRLGTGPYDPDATPPATGGQASANGVLDANTLLRWSLAPGGPERFLALRTAERAGLAGYLAEPGQAGMPGRALLALVDAEHGEDAVAFGLVCGALWLRDAERAAEEQEVYRARGRAERYFGERPPVEGAEFDALARAFGHACEEFVAALLLAARTGPAGQRGEAQRLSSYVLTRAGALVRQFGAESAAGTSPVLEAGLQARFGAVGRALAARSADDIADAVGALDDHCLADDPDAATRIGRARMAQRLVRWLAGAHAPDFDAESATVAQWLGHQVADTGWADRALEHVEAGGDPEPALRSAYDALCADVRARRRELDRRFAHALATWTAAGTPPRSLLTVETFLDRVIAPVAKDGTRRVLLLVLDGMSAAIAAELAEELGREWAEYDPLPGLKDAAGRRAMAAALPTVTAVSRTSLFAGKLMKGTQREEKALFPGHRFWNGQPARVFHKDDLRATDGGAIFGEELSAALEDDRTHVAVVLNIIDDRLANEIKHGDATWRTRDIGALRELLQAAAAQGRAVVITSDHGHVVDRHGVKLPAEDPRSARHRAPGGDLGETEVALHGPRVVSPETDSSIVAVWDNDSRYTAMKAGYHGGAALAEVAIPVLAFLPFRAEPPKGWRELGDTRPAWWSDTPAAERRPPAAGAPVKKAPVRKARAQAELEAAHHSLFDVGDIAPTAPDDDLVTGIIASETFQAQLALLARKPDLAKVEKAVRVLLDAGGTLPVTALAQRIGERPTRADGFAAILRQLLNYDSVQVLQTLPDGRTLRLDKQLLRLQFPVA